MGSDVLDDTEVVGETLEESEVEPEVELDVDVVGVGVRDGDGDGMGLWEGLWDLGQVLSMAMHPKTEKRVWQDDLLPDGEYCDSEHHTQRVLLSHSEHEVC